MTTDPLKPMSIFVVDDHPLMREAVVMLIRRINSKANIVELDRVAAVTASALDYEDLSIEAGADAYVQKSAGATEISNALRVFLVEDPDGEPGAVPEKLSKRQKQLLVMLDRGLSNRDIAEELQISEHTVKVHLWRLFRRLNVKSRSQASHLARTKGLL